MRSRPSIAGVALGRSAGAAPAAERRGSGGWSARLAPRLGGVEGPLAARPGECWAARLVRSGSAGGRAAARLLGDGGVAGRGVWAARPGECWAARLAHSGSVGVRAAARLLGDEGAAGRGVWAARPAGQPCDAEGRPGRRACGREGLAGGHRSKVQLPSSLP